MERSWLIRTTQNQILGPVAKSKVLEFLQKGALGLNDEVTSGNGYWFSLKEKDLVEKYLYGDIPQGYNPISESKSVLSRRDNPDKTTSLNTAPANKTQVMKLGNTGPAVIPPSEDLEYPDIALVNPTLTSQLSAVAQAFPPDEIKLPANDDLEFPDMAMISSTINSSMGNVQTQVYENRPIEMKSRPVEKVVDSTPSSDGPASYPEDDDLAYPDMSSTKAEAKDEKALEEKEEFDFKVNIPQSAPEANKVETKKVNQSFKNDFEDGSGLTLVTINPNKEIKSEKVEKAEPAISLVKKEKPRDQSSHQNDDKKLLHERKVKISAQTMLQKEATTGDLPQELPPRSMPEHLKKRNDNYLMYMLVILVLIILSLFFYYYRTILNKPLPV